MRPDKHETVLSDKVQLDKYFSGLIIHISQRVLKSQLKNMSYSTKQLIQLNLQSSHKKSLWN